MCHARALDYECSLIILSQGYKSKQNGSKCATYTYISGLFKIMYIQEKLQITIQKYT